MTVLVQVPSSVGTSLNTVPAPALPPAPVVPYSTPSSSATRRPDGLPSCSFLKLYSVVKFGSPAAAWPQNQARQPIKSVKAKKVLRIPSPPPAVQIAYHPLIPRDSIA